MATRRSPARRKRRPPAQPGPVASGVQRLVGLHSVREALVAGRRECLRLQIRKDDRRPEVAEIVRLAGSRGVEVQEAPPEALGPRYEGENPQGVLLQAGPLPELDLDAWLAASPRAGPIVALDGVEDPQNVGAIARVAEGAGAAALLLTERRAPPLSPALARASAGAIEWLPVVRAPNLIRALAQLKQAGRWVVGADLDADEDLFGLPDRVLTGELVVVMGAEGRGLRPSVREQVDHPLRIPMAGRVASLNVATATAVLLFEIRRRSERRPLA